MGVAPRESRPWTMLQGPAVCVLVVGDESLMADDLEATLSRSGFSSCGMASSHEEAARLAVLRRPHVILCETRLNGELRGVDIAREIRKVVDTPVVFLTTFADRASVVGATDVEPFGYLVKPCSEQDLQSALYTAAQRGRREQLLMERERWLDATMRSVGDAVVVTALDGSIVFRNDRADSLLGPGFSRSTSPDEWLRVEGDDGRLTPYRPFHQALRERAPVTFHPRTVLDVGQGPIRVEGSTAPIRDHRSELRGVIGVLRDVTDRFALERRVSRSEHLAALGTLSATLVHEIASPLGFAIGNVERVLKALRVAPTSSPEVGAARPVGPATLHSIERDLAEAADGLAHIRTIVRDLRPFVRQAAADRGPLDLRVPIEAALRFLGRQVYDHARVETDLGDAALVLGEEGHLTQIFVNLLANAAEATDPDRPNTIRIRSRTDAADRVVVEVCDTGCGMAPDVLTRAFDPFFTTKPVQGTGLGLSISRNLVTAMHGTLDGTSQPGVGSTFRVGLPRAPVRSAVTESSLAPTQRSRILVIDDEPRMLAAISRALGSNHEVVTFRSARGALSRVEAGEEFDLVVCELVMPDMTGVDFISLATPRWPVLRDRLLIMTAGGVSGEIAEFVARSQLPVLYKPFTMDQICDRVGTLLWRGEA